MKTLQVTTHFVQNFTKLKGAFYDVKAHQNGIVFQNGVTIFQIHSKKVYGDWRDYAPEDYMLFEKYLLANCRVPDNRMLAKVYRFLSSKIARLKDRAYYNYLTVKSRIFKHNVSIVTGIVYSALYLTCKKVRIHSSEKSESKWIYFTSRITGRRKIIKVANQKFTDTSDIHIFV